MEPLSCHALSAGECLKKTKTLKAGLTEKDAAARLKRYGPNALPKSQGVSVFKIILSQFSNPLVYILFAAAAITLFTNHFVDFTIISAVILISAAVGFIQEYKANHSLDELKRLITYHAIVLREGNELVIPAEEVVPGDIVFLEAGNKVPADLRIIETHNLEIIEATLTGESSTSPKKTDKLPPGTSLADRENMAYFGTVVAKGTGMGVVIATGTHTEIGKISKLLKDTPEEDSPLQKQLVFLGRFIGIFLVVLALFLFILGITLGRSWFDMFLISVAVVVAAVPEGILPALTVILAVGMKRIHKNHGLIRKMVSAETLGSVSVICSDKTGTLTTGVMQVSRIATGKELLHKNKDKLHEKISKKEAESHNVVLKIGLLCNNAILENPEEELDRWNIIGDPTERALFTAAYTAGLDKAISEKQEPRVAEIPFDSEYKFMATMHRQKGRHVTYIKGAPEVLLERSTHIDVDGKARKLTKADREQIKAHQKSFSSSGLRVLAVALTTPTQNVVKNSEENFSAETLKNITFVGLIALRDPLRKEAKESIALCRSAGIRTVMITGDHKLTAVAIGKELGLRTNAENILEGDRLEKMSDKELLHAITRVDIYARVAPKHKIRIVEAWQKRGDVVAMTGDGVNDAPALKKADIGIALGSGTDVAKETSDLVLLDDNFSTIVTAVKRGRIIFNNIRKVIVYLMSGSFTELILISGAILINIHTSSDLPLPLLPAQILWIKIAEDAAPAMALAFDEVDKGVMQEPPRGRNEALLPGRFKLFIFFYSFIMDLVLLAIFFYLWNTIGDISYARTFAFAGLGFTSFFVIFSARSLKTHVFRINPFENKFILGSVVIGLAMLLLAIYLPYFHTNILYTTPFGLFEWGLIFAYTALSIFVFELGKRIFLMRPQKKKRPSTDRFQPWIQGT